MHEKAAATVITSTRHRLPIVLALVGAAVVSSLALIVTAVTVSSMHGCSSGREIHHIVPDNHSLSQHQPVRGPLHSTSTASTNRRMFKSKWHATVLESVAQAEQLLSTTPEQRVHNIFVPMLSNRHTLLCCMLTDLDRKLGHTNALDVFVFSVNNAASENFNAGGCRFPSLLNTTVVFMPLREHWGESFSCSSSAMHNASEWVAPQQFDDNYRRMGHWRLTFQFAFADLLGYKYLWQLDDDSFFRSPVSVSMVDYMQRKDLWLAGATKYQDQHFVLRGLPELARLFLVAEQLTPSGTLFNQHTQPAGLDGLFTVAGDPSLDKPPQGKDQGWSRFVGYGNNLLVDMDRFWWPRNVQKFVELAVQTGYHVRFRWNEQGVMGMVWQMFVPDGRFQFGGLPLDYEHPHKFEAEC